MLKHRLKNNYTDSDLINLFNQKDVDAYTYFYNMFYDKLYFFTARLYYNTEIIPADIIQDIFLNILNSKKLSFNSVSHLKDYLYLSARNSFRNYLTHKKYVDEYSVKVSNDEDYFVSHIVEVEVISQLSLMIESLPEECAKVLKLYVEGMDIKEIAQQLGKSQSTVYNQKNEAISMLKNKFPKELLFLIISILN